MLYLNREIKVSSRNNRTTTIVDCIIIRLYFITELILVIFYITKVTVSNFIV